MLKERLKAVNSFVNTLALAIVIIIIFGIFVLPMFYSRKHSKAAKAELREIGSALQDYYAEKGAWPSSGGRAVAEALTGGQEAFSKHERRDEDGRFLDPWETPYRFFFSKDAYAIQSAGRDEKFENEPSTGGDDYWYAPR